MANEDQSSRLEVEIRNPRVVTLLKLLYVLSLELADGISHVFDVLRAFRKLTSPESDQFLGGDPKVLWRREIGCF